MRGARSAHLWVVPPSFEFDPSSIEHIINKGPCIWKFYFPRRERGASDLFLNPRPDVNHGPGKQNNPEIRHVIANAFCSAKRNHLDSFSVSPHRPHAQPGQRPKRWCKLRKPQQLYSSLARSPKSRRIKGETKRKRRRIKRTRRRRRGIGIERLRDGMGLMTLRRSVMSFAWFPKCVLLNDR